MDRRQIGTNLVLNDLGIGLALDSFDDRLTTQKAIYLAQAAGIHLGYQYSWYLRGPYSRGLTSDVFAMKDEIASGLDESEGWALDESSTKKISPLRNLINEGQDDRPRWLELLASVHFLIDRGQIGQSGYQAEAIREKLERYNKDYSVDDVRSAIEKLTSASLLPAGAA